MLFTHPTFNDPPKSVLIVDDDGMIVELLSIGFQAFGFNVFTATNGLDAWELFNSERIDLILTDYQMPGMNGKELSQRIRHKSPSAKIAVMTGGVTEPAQKLLNDGIVDHFFPKPFNLKTVCSILTAEVQAA